jgi:hypothetical protein
MTHTHSVSTLAPAAVGGYRQYVEVPAGSRLLFVEQCRLAWVNVLHQLQAAGYTAGQLVKATAFLTSAELSSSSAGAQRCSGIAAAGTQRRRRIAVGGSSLVCGDSGGRSAVMPRLDSNFADGVRCHHATCRSPSAFEQNDELVPE